MVLRGHTRKMPRRFWDLHSVLQDYTNAELKQIRCPQGRLEQGAKYIDLKDPAQSLPPWVWTDNWYVPKTEVDYQLWNRLAGVQNPERLGDADES